MNTINLPTRSILSRHAAIRMQQRSIPSTVVELLLDFGKATPVRGGATSYRFNAATWDEAMSSIGNPASLRRYRNVYVVESRDGVVITAAWLH